VPQGVVRSMHRSSDTHRARRQPCRANFPLIPSEAPNGRFRLGSEWKRPAKLAKLEKAEDSMASPVFEGPAKFSGIHADQPSSQAMRTVVSVASSDNALSPTGAEKPEG
jgi:hypothetical protein